MKKQIRLLGIDDSPFSFHQKHTTVIGVVMRAGEYLECVLKSKVEIDGSDATDICIEMINNTRYKKQLKAVLLDGASLGGFNIVDIELVSKSTSLAVITVTRDEPDFSLIKEALKKRFIDWNKRLTILQKGELFEVQTSYTPIYIKCAGISLFQAKEIIKISTIQGVIPEPIRVAHVIASGVMRGESCGKA